jgi:iron complex outermembrane receptor protein
MGGTRQTIADRGWLANWPFGFLNPLPPAQSQVGYQQITAFAGYKHDLSPTLALDMSTSLDDTEYQREVPEGGGTTWVNELNESHSEIKSITKALLHWTPNASQQVAGGIEYRHDWLGLPALRDPGIGALDSTFANDDMPRWQTDMISFVGEDQWKINDQWTTFLGGRVDKHTYTNWLFSPRGAIIYTPNSKDAFKLMASQSLRTDIEESMKFDHDSTGGKATDPEIMKTYEFRYERQQNENLSFASSIYFDDLQVLGWDQNAQATKNLGKYSSIGAEGEINYRTHDTDITFSHSFVKLVNFDLNAGATTSISAAPEGEGWDIASFPQQITKLTAHRQLNEKLSIDGSTRVDWNFPGDKDFLKFGNLNPKQGDPFNGFPPSSVPGWNPFGPSIFVDLGVQYKFNEHATLRLDAYNVLGWINRNYNKRDFLATQWYGQFRDEAPALGVTFKYEF